MREEIQELIKKCEHDYGITVDARDQETYWVITARIPKNQETLFRGDHVRKYIATRNDRGSVLIVPDPQVSDRYFVETWGEMETFGGFCEKGNRPDPCRQEFCSPGGGGRLRDPAAREHCEIPAGDYGPVTPVIKNRISGFSVRKVQ